MSCSADEVEVLLIGYGNPLRGDDAAGAVAARRAVRTLNRPDVGLITVRQLVPELVPKLSRARLAIFLDACCDQAPGEVQCRPIPVAAEDHRLFTHVFDPAALLALSRRLFGCAPEAFAVTVGGRDFSMRRRLSAEVARAIPDMVELVRARVREHITGRAVATHAGSSPAVMLVRKDADA